FGSPEYNMAVDEALLRNFKDGDLPIIRLYRWEPSISLGRFSKLEQSVDIKALQKQNLSYVRRMTGGGILAHGGDLSYSITVPRRTLKDIGVKESYRYLCQFLINLYEKLGLKAEFAHDLKLESSKSNICMASNEPYDIIIDDRKIGGNAQRYTKEVLFQHGSIPIKLDAALFKDVFLEESGLKDIATLDRIGSSVIYEKLKAFLIEAFMESFDAQIIRDDLNTSQIKRACELQEKKYTNIRWNINGKQN
ncbi:MAG: lipoate--protein ligase family protein, partial [Campylobacterota bacterium]|nr:lipoate--protein ligase family protein [Campylobacterota bacterium]